jgi:hypothetical protein
VRLLFDEQLSEASRGATWHNASNSGKARFVALLDARQLISRRGSLSPLVIVPAAGL